MAELNVTYEKKSYRRRSTFLVDLQFRSPNHSTPQSDDTATQLGAKRKSYNATFSLDESRSCEFYLDLFAKEKAFYENLRLKFDTSVETTDSLNAIETILKGESLNSELIPDRYKAVSELSSPISLEEVMDTRTRTQNLIQSALEEKRQKVSAARHKYMRIEEFKRKVGPLNSYIKSRNKLLSPKINTPMELFLELKRLESLAL